VSDATFPYGTASRPFDDEGLPGQRTEFIQEGTLRRFLAGKRYADYLGIEPTGPAGVLVLNTGRRAEGDLLDPGSGSLLRVVSFSSLDPDFLTGDFSAEIRLGYLLTLGGTQPVKGGTVSGNVLSAFGRAQLDSEEVFLGRYSGPKLVRFGNLSVTGGNS
jgi:PmbA protein